MTTLADVEARLSDLAADVEQLRSVPPSEVDMLDAVIRWATERRASLISWVPESGDWSIVREIARAREVDGAWGWGQAASEAWNPGVITADEMASTFGPDWVHVVALVRTGAGLTSAQKQAYQDAVMRVYNEDRPAWDAAYRAVFVVVGPGYAARRALWAFVGDGFDAGAAAALARRSEIQDGIISQGHYDRLTRAWREEIGPVHPEDEAL